MKDTLFKKVDYSLLKLIEDIDLCEIGLPEIQRPFVERECCQTYTFDKSIKYGSDPDTVKGRL